MEEGGIPEEEGVTREILEEEEEAWEEIHPATTNCRDSSQPFSKETDGSRRHSCKNGTYTTGSTDTPPK